jgi:hypothetical protein
MTSLPAFVKVGENPCYLGETSCKNNKREKKLTLLNDIY